MYWRMERSRCAFHCLRLLLVMQKMIALPVGSVFALAIDLNTFQITVTSSNRTAQVKKGVQ